MNISPNHSMQRMRASRSGQWQFVYQWRLASTADASRWPLGLYICVTKVALLPSEISWAQSGKLRISDTH
jgi:hypothetical protein